MNNQDQYKRTVDSTAEPVSTKALQDHLLGFNTDDNAMLTELNKVCRGMFERDTNMALVDQTWSLARPHFSHVIKLKKSPLRSITSIQYYDGSGTLQTLDPTIYRTDDHGVVARITEAFGKTYPSVETDRSDAVIITFVAGVYTTTGSPGDVVDKDTNPATDFIARYRMAEQAIKILATHLYENRAVVAPIQLHQTPMSYQSLVDACRVSFF